MNPHFYVPHRFGALPDELSRYETSDVVIFPVPYDQTTTYNPGARNGPRAMIHASRFLEFNDEDTGRNYTGRGICTLDELEIVDDSKALQERIVQAVGKLLDDHKKIAIIGGEHSLAFGSVRAFKERFENLSVLHIDAHADMRDFSNENQHSHATVARRISELVPVTSVGIRSLSEEEAAYHSEKSIPVFYAREMMKDDSWMDLAIETLSENVYVTLDVDAFDSGIMPATGTPQPGGMSWYQMIDFLQKLSEKKNVVGFDVCELSPQPGNAAPDFLVAKLFYKMIGMFFRKEVPADTA